MTTVPKSEKRCNLLLWLRDGVFSQHRGVGKPNLEVSIGRTNSRLGLGFVIGETTFVLDRTQVQNLASFLTWQADRMRGSGRAGGIEFASLIKESELLKRNRVRGRQVEFTAENGGGPGVRLAKRKGRRSA